MKIAVMATGGVGGVFGAKLAQAGEDVTFIARGPHLEAIRNNGLTIANVHNSRVFARPTNDLWAFCWKGA